MNANAYGGELGRGPRMGGRLHGRGRGATAARRRLGFAYRRSNLRPGEVVSPRLVSARRRRPGGDQGDDGRDARQAPRGPALGDQDVRLDLQEPGDDARAEGRTAGQLLEAAGCRGLPVGGARFSPKHANFVENAGEATTADVLALMAEARRRVHERFGVELEPEVQMLGEVEWPDDWELADSTPTAMPRSPGEEPARPRARIIRLWARTAATAAGQAAHGRAQVPPSRPARPDRPPAEARRRRPDAAGRPYQGADAAAVRPASARCARATALIAGRDPRRRRWRSPTSPGSATPRSSRSTTSRWRACPAATAAADRRPRSPTPPQAA